MSHRPVSAAASLAVLAVTASLLLGGCSLLPRIPILNPGGNDGGSSSDGESSNGDGVEDNPFLGHEVPDGFPSEVPLPDLEIIFSLNVSEAAWSILYGASDLQADFASVNDDFTAEGWEVVMSNAGADAALGVYRKDDLQVQVTGSADGGNDYDGPVLSFTVVRSS